jgi:cytochrome c-type biogenesis protein CcmH/NrfF
VAACPQTSLGDLEDEVMCPVCGTSLGLATEAPQAQRERAFIQGLIDDCKSKEEIKTALVAQFGDEVLATPGDDGFDLAAYLIPLAILLGAGAAIIVGVRRWRARPAAAASADGASARESKRLDEDLARYDL